MIAKGMFHVQTEQMSRIVNELDSIHFSIKKATKLVKEIGRQVDFWNIHLLFHTLRIVVIFITHCDFSFLFLVLFILGCNGSVYYGIARPYCHWSHSHHHCEGMKYAYNSFLIFFYVCSILHILLDFALSSAIAQVVLDII